MSKKKSDPLREALDRAKELNETGREQEAAELIRDYIAPALEKRATASKQTSSLAAAILHRKSEIVVGPGSARPPRPT